MHLLVTDCSDILVRGLVEIGPLDSDVVHESEYQATALQPPAPRLIWLEMENFVNPNRS